MALTKTEILDGLKKLGAALLAEAEQVGEAAAAEFLLAVAGHLGVFQAKVASLNDPRPQTETAPAKPAPVEVPPAKPAPVEVVPPADPAKPAK